MDLYIIHRFDYETLMEETMEALAGKVRAVGASTMYGYQFYNMQLTAEKYGVTMTGVSLAWQFAKGVTSPLIGATKARYFDDAVGAFDVKLTAEDIAYLEEPYVPHRIVGAI